MKRCSKCNHHQVCIKRLNLEDEIKTFIDLRDLYRYAPKDKEAELQGEMELAINSTIASYCTEYKE